jgi:hypothetical protein
MTQRSCLVSALVLLVLAGLTATTAQERRPVAALHAAEQQRERALAASFTTIDVMAVNSVRSPLQVSLTAGDLERAFDTPAFRPDAAIIPTNTELVLASENPTT